MLPEPLKSCFDQAREAAGPFQPGRQTLAAFMSTRPTCVWSYAVCRGFPKP
jgi:hypothetical protein